ncbi:MAG: DNA primase [Alphaproteobacteria bacterium]|nr:DNA primase [Alphaproteobacteria bacterium]
MSFSSDFLDLLRDRVRVSEVVARKVSLRKDGREFKGLCPFHNEKTPSFYVNDDKGFYHCFGCGAHGSQFDFIMETEGRSFPEAVEALAGLAGVEVPRESPEARERQQHRNSLQDVLEAACRYFERQLDSPAGAEARAYLDRRRITQTTRRRFRLGYAPGGRTALTQFLKKEGFDEALAIEAGLHKPAEDGRSPIDYFRDRVIFPITDRRDRVIGFGGRVLGDGQPKYLNSPETPLFDKSRVLYGIAQARDAARKADAIIVAEGYMDVIALSQAGIEFAVAPLGTALTEQQLEELWKLAPEPLLCFDGDAAGLRAAARAAERALPLLQPGRSLQFVRLPEGQDPDDLIQEGGRQAMEELLAAAKPLVETLVEMEAAALERQTGPLDTPERKADLKKRLRQRVAKIVDQDIRALYVQAVREQLDALLGFVPRDGQAGAGAGPRRPWVPRSGRGGQGYRGEAFVDPYQVQRYNTDRQSVARTKARREQELLVALMLHHPVLVDEFWEGLSALNLPDPELEPLREALLNHIAHEGVSDIRAAHASLRNAGLDSAIGRVISSDVIHDHPYAAPAGDEKTARLALGDLLRRGLHQSMLVELEDAKAAVIAEPSEANHARLSALKEALGRMGGSAEDPAMDGGGRSAAAPGAANGGGSFF